MKLLIAFACIALVRALPPNFGNDLNEAASSFTGMVIAA